MKKFLTLSFAFLFCLVAMPAMATSSTCDYYVDATNGDDSNSGSSSAPYQTITKVLDAMSGGNEACLAGTFTGAFEVTAGLSGTADDYTTFKQWSGEDQAVIDGTGLSAAMVILSGDYIKFDGLETNGPDSSNTAIFITGNYIILNDLNVHDAGHTGVYLHASSSNTTVQDSIFTDNDHNNILDGGTNNVIYGNDISNTVTEDLMMIYMATGSKVYGNKFSESPTDQSAIMVYGSSNSEIYNNIFEETEAGVSLISQIIGFGTTDGTKIFNNDFYGTDLGLLVGDSTYTDPVTSTESKNNIFYQQTGDAGVIVHTNSTGNLTSDYNLFYIEDGGAIGTYGFTSAVTLAAWQAASSQDANSLEADPEFASLVGVSGVHAQTATENNFYLKSDSPAIDAGTDLSDYFTDDYVGVTRPYEEAWDIGAYEYATPEKPTKLKVKDKGAKWLKLKWTASPSTISKYWVKIATDESFSDMVGYEVAADKTSKKITGLLPNKKYYIKVKAQYESYYSGYSNIKRPRTMPPQAKKKYMKAKSITSNSAVLKWKKPKRAITRYVLQLKVGKDIIDTIKLKRPTGNKAKKKWNNKKQWQKTQLIDLTEDTTYKWRLRSKYKKINSKWSKYKKFTTKSE